MKSLLTEGIRKCIHLLAIPLVVFYLIANYYFGEEIALLGLTSFLIALLMFEFARLERAFTLPLVVESILRKREKNNITGSIYFVLAAIIALAIFDVDIAVAALLMATLGDFVAAILGKYFGKKKIYKTKTYVGTTSCLIVNAAVGLFFLGDIFFIGLVMAVVATAIETISVKVDDNLTVPIFTGFVGQILLYFIP